jgi:hypothetical protein
VTGTYTLQQAKIAWTRLSLEQKATASIQTFGNEGATYAADQIDNLYKKRTTE